MIFETYYVGTLTLTQFLNPVAAEIRYLLLFREYQLNSGLTKTNTLCWIESAELKGKVSMTQLLSHTIAHFTGPSFMRKANNQPYQKILGLAFS